MPSGLAMRVKCYLPRFEFLLAISSLMNRRLWAMAVSVLSKKECLFVPGEEMPWVEEGRWSGSNGECWND